MREILFRGKSIDGAGNLGEWEYGGIVHQIDYYGDTVDDYYIIDGTSTQDYDIGYETKVDPDTVGQYTGLTDKNGKKIFEGDILKIAKVSSSTGDYYDPPIDYPVNVVVRWDLCAWLWETIGENEYYLSFPDAWHHYECELIGNIHDNPELLEARE